MAVRVEPIETELLLSASLRRLTLPRLSSTAVQRVIGSSSPTGTIPGQEGVLRARNDDGQSSPPGIHDNRARGRPASCAASVSQRRWVRGDGVERGIIALDPYLETPPAPPSKSCPSEAVFAPAYPGAD